MQPKIGEVALHNIRIIDKNEFFIGDFCILPIELSHDAADPVGYSLMAGNRKVSILTDTGKVTPKMLDAAANSSIVLLESNHDVDMLKNGSYPYLAEKPYSFHTRAFIQCFRRSRRHRALQTRSTRYSARPYQQSEQHKNSWPTIRFMLNAEKPALSSAEIWHWPPLIAATLPAPFN